MATGGAERSGLGRAFVAHALVCLLLIQSALAAVGATRAYGPDGVFIPGVICSVSGSANANPNGDADTGQTRPSGYHCILCSVAQGGLGPAVPASPTPLLTPRIALVVQSPRPPLDAPPPALMGWTTSWSSRAPPQA